VQPDDIDSESLLNIPLVKQMLDDPTVDIVVRGIDANWHYVGLGPGKLSGFNPFTGCIFVGKNSFAEKWLLNPAGSARELNFKDRLVSEILFAVHDYLHVWAYNWIAELAPEIGFGTKPITLQNFEDMVFCHILTEAVATVGLDYWYLSRINLNEIAPIGTGQQSLTIAYQESHGQECRRFFPDFDVQQRAFFGSIVKFYCDGIFNGFDAEDLLRSPVIHRWLDHELTYGKMQRRYCREWFSFLGEPKIGAAKSQLDRPIDYHKEPYDRLIDHIGELLWDKVNNGHIHSCKSAFDPAKIWQPIQNRKAKYQFLNLNKIGLPTAKQARQLTDESFNYLIGQFVGQFDYALFPKEAIPIFDLMLERKDFALGLSLFDSFKRVDCDDREPANLFLYN